MHTRTDSRVELLLAARTAHARRDWHTAYEAFMLAGEVAPLSTDDLDALAAAAWQLGYGKESVRVAEQVFASLIRTDPAAAAMKAVDLALAWLTRGDVNIAHGWMNRARRLLDGAPVGSTHGYLGYLDALMAAKARDTDELAGRVEVMRDLCTRIESPAVTALCRVAEALQAILDARMTEAYGLIDEAMLAVLADQVPIDWAGDIYCVVLNECHRLADLPRMRAWTQSMQRWCADFAVSTNYGGVCDVHRLQVMAETDNYLHLEDRLYRASRALADVNSWAAGEGFYQLGEVRRRRGDLQGAHAAFAQARAFGIDPQPGEALLRCGQGDSAGAWTELRVALSGEDRLARLWLLRAAIAVALARGDLEEAEQYCRELESGAEAFGTPGFRAWAAHARGALMVAQSQHEAALPILQKALREYRTQQSRYETAEVYEWMAMAHRALGDASAVAADVATAENIYAQLGVEPAGVGDAQAPGGLTKRELEILRRVAEGVTNRVVAQQLFISEKTVGRHLANIYTKLQVSSRTAALAWARQHNVL